MNTLQLTKDQLRRINERRGQLNVDDGTVFLGVVGRRHADGLFHVEVQQRNPNQDERLDEFSMREVLEGEKGLTQ